MFVCKSCGKVSKPGELSNKWVVKKRKKNYRLLDKKGEQIGAVTGWEIEQEIIICRDCYNIVNKDD